MKPAESKLPDEELAVCRRLREVRLRIKWDMPAVAEAMRITRDRWASYEYGRAPVRFWLAQRFCARFNINQRWLATGQPPMEPYIEIGISEEVKIDLRMLHTEACKKLANEIQAQLVVLAARAGRPVEELGPLHEETTILYRSSMAWLKTVIESHLAAVPDPIKQQYLEALSEASLQFLKEHVKEILSGKELRVFRFRPAIPIAPERDAKYAIHTHAIDAQSEIRNTGGMKSVMGSLLDAVRRLTGAPGMKARLAEYLDVPPSRVSEWLGGKYEPSGEIALKLAEWVRAKEAQQEAGHAGGETPARPETRSKEQSNEPKKQVRKKS